MSAYNELMEYLQKGEEVEGIVFGAFGWYGSKSNLGYKEPKPPPVPFNKRRRVLTLEQAEPYMQQDWSFYGGYGAPECYATYIWTNKRVLWVTQYDGSTSFDSMPRNPCNCIPIMPGG